MGLWTCWIIGQFINCIISVLMLVSTYSMLKKGSGSKKEELKLSKEKLMRSNSRLSV